MPNYHPQFIEPKWRERWLRERTFRTPDHPTKPKYYILDMFPYPSSDGLHVGHPEGYTATDIIARYKRMRGFDVMHPMGWDAFGLPAEQFAVKTNTHPRITTAQNIENFRRQIQSLGFSYDWDREIDTTDPLYTRWTQWIFLRLYHSWYDHERQSARPIAELPIPPEVAAKGESAAREYRDAHRLAYVANVPVNWCEALGTVLANEEVINGRSERGDHPVVRLPLRQWMLRITAYAERLLSDLDEVDWPTAIKDMQRHWIGKSEGAEVDFPILVPDKQGSNRDRWFAERQNQGFPADVGADVVRVYTTRPDTLFGATYMVLAPEHPLALTITTPEQREAVEMYRRQAAAKSDLDRTDLAKRKTGVFTGAYALNPVNREPIPIWIADYVLLGYGTGAIMAVPAHDDRDFEFAQRFDLDIVEVVAQLDETPAILVKVHEWLGEWERRQDRDTQAKYIKVAILLNCGFDLESFDEDRIEYQRDPLWAEVDVYVDETEGKGIAVRYLEEEFGDILAEYIDMEDDTEVFVLTLDPSVGGEEGDEDDEDDDDHDADHDEHDHDEHGACVHEQKVGAFTADGLAVNSGLITGLPTARAKSTMIEWLERKGLGKRNVRYKLRDWLFSRQRYWGEPFPILLDEEGRHEPLRDDELPLLLPDLSDFKPTGTPESPLSRAADWLRVTRDGKTYRRETNTMPQWAGSCWYYLRFLDPRNSSAPFDAQKAKEWLPVDLYVGGAEHAVLHLLYSRFWHKVLFDLGLVPTTEPFRRLVNQGMILGETDYTGWKVNGKWISADRLESDQGSTHKVTRDGIPAEPVTLDESQVAKDQGHWVLDEDHSIRVDARAHKMSKSRGNVINPDQVVSEYGADSLRLYEMFMGPLEATKPWSMKGVDGIWRFLNRVWRLVIEENADQRRLSSQLTDDAPEDATLRLLHRVIRGVTEDIEAMRFNTAISKLMELVNHLTPLAKRPRAVMEPLVLLLSPFAPHLAEELWESLGHGESLAYHPWPAHDEALCVESQIEVAIQINNKLRAKLLVSAALADQELIAQARREPALASQFAGKRVLKEFVVNNRKGKLVNFVVQ